MRAMSDDDFEYYLKQSTLIVIGLVFIIGNLVWVLPPLYEHKHKMDKVIHNHQVHGQHFYKCDCKY